MNRRDFFHSFGTGATRGAALAAVVAVGLPALPAAAAKKAPRIGTWEKLYGDLDSTGLDSHPEIMRAFAYWSRIASDKIKERE